MNVTIEESAAIYAKMTRKRFGAKAYERTRERVEELVRAGDLEGAKVHESVMRHLSQLEVQAERESPASPRRAARG